MIYLDTAALVKLVRVEAESPTLVVTDTKNRATTSGTAETSNMTTVAGCGHTAASLGTGGLPPRRPGFR